VLLTAPGKGNIPNIVYGANHKNFNPADAQIYSAASCTTNAIVPVIQAIHQEYGIESGHIESVHSYTNDQNLLDNFHKKFRRGRSAPLNMVITETGAAKAVSKVLPEMADKMTGNAVRVPTPNVSLAILNLNLARKVESIEEVNYILKQAASYGDLVEQIDFSTSTELVSTDCIGNPHASIVDSQATLVAPSNQSIVLYVWYDNEYGYTCQVVRLAKYLAQVQRFTYY
jgi:glyceraldehyde 3-phosphate dehydrogenase